MGRVAILVATGAVAVGALSGYGQEEQDGAQPGVRRQPGNRDFGQLVGRAGTGRADHPDDQDHDPGQAGQRDTGRVTVSLGTPATLPVTSDVADEIQVRGYDRKVKVPAGGTVSVSFTTSASGVFDVELRQSRFGAAAG